MQKTSWNQRNSITPHKEGKKFSLKDICPALQIKKVHSGKEKMKN